MYTDRHRRCIPGTYPHIVRLGGCSAVCIIRTQLNDGDARHNNNSNSQAPAVALNSFNQRALESVFLCSCGRAAQEGQLLTVVVVVVEQHSAVLPTV